MEILSFTVTQLWYFLISMYHIYLLQFYIQVLSQNALKTLKELYGFPSMFISFAVFFILLYF